MWDTTPNTFLGDTSGGRAAPQGSCTWQFDGSEWVLARVDAKNGGVPGEPPTIPGKFKGHLRVTPCVAPQTAEAVS